MRIIFMGTPDFAVPCLEKLIDNGYDVAAVVTQPDKPAGRKQSVPMAQPVKQAALKHGIKTILQPEKIRTQEFLDIIKSISPDLIITAAYGKILPKSVLDTPRLGCINVHGSLLPKYRGASPIQWAIINGDSVTGITTMYMDEGMDTGDILLQREIKIPGDMTYLELYESLKELGAQTLLETLKELEQGTLRSIPQEHSKASTVPMMNKKMGLIDWNRSSADIHNLVRGTNPWPGAYTFYRGKRLRIWKTGPEADIQCPQKNSAGNADAPKPGTICKILKDSLVVATGGGCLGIFEVQFDSGRKMSIRECGHNMDEGECLG